MDGSRKARPLFLVGKAFDGKVATSGNGQMVALLAPTREAVRRCYDMAIKMGATGDGEPGLRPHYHEHYYGAYFRDPDDNSLELMDGRHYRRVWRKMNKKENQY